MYAKLVDADCAKDIYQRRRAVDGAKAGGWRDPVVLHPQQFHRLRPWGGHHVSCVLACVLLQQYVVWLCFSLFETKLYLA